MAMIGKPPAVDPNAPVSPGLLASAGSAVSPYLTQPGAMQALPDSSQVMPNIAPQHQGGPSWAGILGDALLGAAGQPGQYGPAMQRQRQADYENQIYMQRQAADWEHQRQQFMLGLQYPNSEMDQAARSLAQHPVGDPLHNLYAAYAVNKAFPPHMVTQEVNGVQTTGMLQPPPGIIDGINGPPTGSAPAPAAAPMTREQMLAAGATTTPGGQPAPAGHFRHPRR